MSDSTIDLHFEEHGSGPPLVLIYGAGGDHRCWEPQVEALSAERRLILPDMRGSGHSGAPDGEWSISTYAEDVIALLDRLGIERAAIGGMSMGAAVTLRLLVDHPDRVTKAIVMNPWARTDVRMTLLWNHVLFLQDLLAKAADADRHAQDLTDLNLAWFFSSNALAEHRDSVDRWWEVYGAGVQPEGSGKHFRSLMGHDVTAGLPGVDTPVLVIGGEEDYFTPHHVREVAALLPNAEFHLLESPGASHGLHWERPGDVNALILGFLAAEAAG